MPWKSYFKIIRPINLLVMALMIVLVRYAIFMPVFAQNGLSGLMPAWQFIFLLLATAFIGAGGYVINDVLDVEIDRINKPAKMVISRTISEETGNKLHFNLTAAGVLSGFLFSYFAGNIFLAVLFVIIPTALFYYSYKYKYLPAVGNIVVAMLAGINVLIYWLFEFYHLKSQPELFIDASLVFSQLNRFILSFALFAFLTTLVREIIKDAQDVEGDARFGCRTLPVVIGIPGTKILLAILELVTMAALAWFQFVLLRTGYWWMCCTLIITQAMILFAMYRTLRAQGKNDFSFLSLYYKFVMIAGMATLVTSWFRNY